MEIPTKGDFEIWKSSPVTQSFFYAAQERVKDAMEVLSIEAGLNPVQDNVLRGLIRAYREILDFRIDDQEVSVE